MATLKTNTLTGTSTAGSIAVTGEANSTTTNLQQGLIKVWVNFDGTATDAAARDSFNISGMTDNGTGDYTITINNNMANDDYAGGTLARQDAGGSDAFSRQSDTATNEVRLVHVNGTDGTLVDVDIGSVALFGDLA